MTAFYEQGEYRAKILDQRFGELPNDNKTPYLALTIQPTQATGPNNLAPGGYEREVKLFLTERAFKYSMKRLRDLGWTGSDFQQLDPSNPNYFRLAGKEIDVVCEYNEEGFENWDFKFAGGGEREENNPKIAAALNRMFGAKLLADAKGQPAVATEAPLDQPAPAAQIPAVPSTGPPPAEEPQFADDEIPF